MSYLAVSCLILNMWEIFQISIIDCEINSVVAGEYDLYFNQFTFIHTC